MTITIDAVAQESAGGGSARTPSVTLTQACKAAIYGFLKSSTGAPGNLDGTFDGSPMPFVVGSGTGGTNGYAGILAQTADVSAGVRASSITWDTGAAGLGWLVGVAADEDVSIVSATPYESVVSVGVLGGAIATEPGDMLLGFIRHQGSSAGAVADETFNNVFGYSGYNRVISKQASAGATTDFIYTSSNMSNAKMSVLVLRESAPVIVLDVENVDGDNQITEGQTFTINDSQALFEAVQGSGSVEIDGIPQTIISWSAGAIVCTQIANSNRFGFQDLVVKTDSSGDYDPIQIEIEPTSAQKYADITDASDPDLLGDPILKITDQIVVLSVTSPGGYDVTPDSFGNVSIDGGSSDINNESFDFKVWDRVTKDYGLTATHTITSANAAPTITGSSAVTTSENQLNIAQYTIDNRDGQLPTLSGADAALFDVNFISGDLFQLAWASSPDFETLGAGPHNLQIDIDDGTNSAVSLVVAVTLTDIDEISPQPVLSYVGGTITGPVNVTIDTGESTNDFGEPDVNIAGGTASGVTGSGQAYTLQVTPSADSSGNMTIDIPAGGYQDAAGNLNLVATQLVIPYNTLAPEIVSVNAGGDITPGSTIIVNTIGAGFVAGVARLFRNNTHYPLVVESWTSTQQELTVPNDLPPANDYQLQLLFG